MNLLGIFQRRNPGRELALKQHRDRRAHVRAVCDQMRAEMGLPAVRWPQ